jgi:hypothetical protein
MGGWLELLSVTFAGSPPSTRLVTPIFLTKKKIMVPPEGLLSTNGEGRFVVAVNNKCPVCQGDVVAGQGWVMAVGRPYHCLIHWKCRGYFELNGEWPHERTASEYYVGDLPALETPENVISKFE